MDFQQQALCHQVPTMGTTKGDEAGFLQGTIFKAKGLAPQCGQARGRLISTTSPVRHKSRLGCLHAVWLPLAPRAPHGPTGPWNLWMRSMSRLPSESFRNRAMIKVQPRGAEDYSEVPPLARASTSRQLQPGARVSRAPEGTVVPVRLGPGRAARELASAWRKGPTGPRLLARRPAALRALAPAHPAGRAEARRPGGAGMDDKDPGRHPDRGPGGAGARPQPGPRGAPGEALLTAQEEPREAASRVATPADRCAVGRLRVPGSLGAGPGGGGVPGAAPAPPGWPRARSPRRSSSPPAPRQACVWASGARRPPPAVPGAALRVVELALDAVGAFLAWKG